MVKKSHPWDWIGNSLLSAFHTLETLMTRNQQQRRIGYVSRMDAGPVELRDLLNALVGVTSALDFGIVERDEHADLTTRSGLATAARLLAEQVASRIQAV
jgi:hypothetical protein